MGETGTNQEREREDRVRNCGVEVPVRAAATDETRRGEERPIPTYMANLPFLISLIRRSSNFSLAMPSSLVKPRGS